MKTYKSVAEIRERIKEVEKIFEETRKQRIDLAKSMYELGIRSMKSPISFNEEVTMDSLEQGNSHSGTASQEVELLRSENSECQTPGAIYHTEVHSDNVSCKVDFPFEMDLTSHEARELQDKLHNAMERVLSRYWSDAYKADSVRKGMTEDMKNMMGKVYQAISHMEPEAAALEEACTSAEKMFFKGQKVTLVDPYQVVDVIDVSEFGDRAQIKYYDCRDGGDIVRWVGRDEVMERSSV